MADQIIRGLRPDGTAPSSLLAEIHRLITAAGTVFDRAVTNGFSGTEQEWLDSLVGAPGTPGARGPQGSSGDYMAWRWRAAYLDREEKLTKWRSALATAITAQVNIVAFGDSITEGTGSSDTRYRWINQLQDGLRYRTLGTTAGAAYPWIPSVPVTSAPGIPVTQSPPASVPRNNGAGLGWKSGTIAAGKSLTFNFTGTSFKVNYFGASSTGVMAISVDGGAPTLVDTNKNTGPGGSGGAITWTSPSLSRGDHTVQVAHDQSSPAGYTLMVNGLLTYDQDEAAGVRVLDAAYHGMGSNFLTPTRNDAAALGVEAVGNVGLVLVNIGTNDYGTGTTPAAYKANLQGFITRLRQVYSGTIVLMNAYRGSARDDALWEPYGVVLAEIAATDPDIAYFDWRIRMPDIPDPYDAPPGLGLYADPLHPDDSGHEWIAGFLTDYLSLRA